MDYRVDIAPPAEREFRKLPREVQVRLGSRIDLLAGQPRPAQAAKLSGTKGYRVRVGDYRILYEIDDVARVVLVVKVGHRRDVYRRVLGRKRVEARGRDAAKDGSCVFAFGYLGASPNAASSK